MSIAIVPAAGKAERFGSAKLVADLGGEPLVVRTVRSLFSGGVTRVVVVTAAGSPVLDLRDRWQAPPGAEVSIVVNPNPDRGMFSSIQTGLASAEGNPILVLPADMPFVRPDTVATVLAAVRTGPPAIVLPACRGSHGHPIGMPGSLAAALVEADPRSTLKAALSTSGLQYRELSVDDLGVLRDVDVPGDLGAIVNPSCRARRAR